MSYKFTKYAGGGSSGGSSGGGIIDVTSLPTENIDENALYRVPVGTFLMNYVVQSGEVRAVNDHQSVTNPEPCTLDGETINVTYYNTSDGVLYGYVSDAIAPALSAPAGWYPATTLFAALGVDYGGIVTSVTDASAQNNIYVLLEYKMYSYKGKWVEERTLKSLTMAGGENGLLAICGYMMTKDGLVPHNLDYEGSITYSYSDGGASGKLSMPFSNIGKKKQHHTAEDGAFMPAAFLTSAIGGGLIMEVYYLEDLRRVVVGNTYHSAYGQYSKASNVDYSNVTSWTLYYF